MRVISKEKKEETRCIDFEHEFIINKRFLKYELN